MQSMTLYSRIGCKKYVCIGSRQRAREKLTEQEGHFERERERERENQLSDSLSSFSEATFP